MGLEVAGSGDDDPAQQMLPASQACAEGFT